MKYQVMLRQFQIYSISTGIPRRDQAEALADRVSVGLKPVTPENNPADSFLVFDGPSNVVIDMPINEARKLHIGDILTCDIYFDS